MDLSGHHQFDRASADRASVDRPGPPPAGALLLSAGWAALASARAESLAIRLVNGAVITGVQALRASGPVAEAATIHGQWTHYFLIADVVLVEVVPRGGRRPEHHATPPPPAASAAR